MFRWMQRKVKAWASRNYFLEWVQNLIWSQTNNVWSGTEKSNNYKLPWVVVQVDWVPAGDEAQNDGYLQH